MTKDITKVVKAIKSKLAWFDDNGWHEEKEYCNAIRDMLGDIQSMYDEDGSKELRALLLYINFKLADIRDDAKKNVSLKKRLSKFEFVDEVAQYIVWYKKYVRVAK